MSATLYYSRNPNPRLAVATARYLNAPVDLVWAAPFDPSQSDFFRKLNPMLRIPILVENAKSLWEADAIACRLCQMVGSDFWRMDAEMPELIRWISWGKANFVQACDMVSFELGTKQRYQIGPVDPEKEKEGRESFAEAASVLNAQLCGRDFLLESGISYADFRMATFLPFNDVMNLPLADFPDLSRWYDRLLDLSFWNDPFSGLNAPDLPAIPKSSP